MSEDEPTISELFARDPFTYTKEDIDRIIAHYRDARKQFNLGGKGAKPDKPAVNLADLGLA